MIRWYILYLFLLSGQIFSQNQVLDSLNRKFSQTTSVKDKAIIQMELSDYWSYRDTVKAFQHLKFAAKFVADDEYLKGVLLFYKAGIYFNHNIEKAQKLYMDSEDVLKKNNSLQSFEYRARLWHNFAVLEQIQDKNENFLTITLEKCIPYAQKSGNTTLVANYYVDVGMVFSNYREFSKAIVYYNKAIEILKGATKKDETLVWAYLNMANSYHETNSLDLMHEALTSAEKHLGKIPVSQYNVLAYLQKSRYLSAKGNAVDALKHIQKGIALANDLNLEYDYLNLSYEYFRLLKKEKKHNEAKVILTNLLNDKKFASKKKNRLIFLTEMANLEKELGNFKTALSYNEQFQILNDSIQKENEKFQILNLETQYKTKEQEKDLAYLKTKNKQQSTIIIISLLLLLVVISFFLYALKQRKKSNEQKLYALKQQRTTEINEALYEGEIQERERIAKDLHDGIGGRITGIKIHLENFAQQHKNFDLHNLTSQLEICLSELRNTARNLTPETLRRFGLEDAIKDFCENMSTSKTTITCYIKNLNQCKDIKKQIHIFHIVQETVNNAMKHSNASQILVQCTLENDLLLLDIEDNGIGFVPDQAKRSLGINNIEKRVHALNGSLQIHSSPNNGTAINIEAKI